MKYVQPYGITDPNAGYINGDPSIARQGSIPPAEAFEHPMREIVAVISKSGIAPSAGDLQQLVKSVRSQAVNFVADTGSVNALSVALDPPLTAYTPGLPIRVKVANTNTGPATINAGAGTVPIKKPNGAALAAGDLPAAGMAELVYDGAAFQMINFGGAGGGGPGDVFMVNIPYTVDTSATVNSVIANFSPAITALSAGTIIMVKIANTNNGFATINVNGLGPKPIKAQGGHVDWPLLPGDIMVGDTVVLIYDGTAFWVYPNIAINQSVQFNVATVAQINSLFVALGRKRISTAGFVTVQLAAGVYTPDAGTGSVITTYHADSERIVVAGTMQAGQVPPVTANFARSGPSAAQRAADSAANIVMLRARYATEVRMPAAPVNGMTHSGPGMIIYKNILITGPNAGVTAGQRGISAPAGASINAVQCSVWGSGDAGIAADGNGHVTCYECHSLSNYTRGYASAGATISCTGGGAYGNGTIGAEAAYGGSFGCQAHDQVTITNGPFASQCNGVYGTSAQQATVLVVASYINANQVVDMYSFNMGSSGQYLASVGSMSPAGNTEGNLNSISVIY